MLAGDVPQKAERIDRPAIKAVLTNAHTLLWHPALALVQVPRVKRVRVKPTHRSVVDERLVCHRAWLVVNGLAVVHAGVPSNTSTSTGTGITLKARKQPA